MLKQVLALTNAICDRVKWLRILRASPSGSYPPASFNQTRKSPLFGERGAFVWDPLGGGSCFGAGGYARVTLPAFMQLVQTLALRTWPFSSRIVIFCTFGRNMRLVTR